MRGFLHVWGSGLLQRVFEKLTDHAGHRINIQQERCRYLDSGPTAQRVNPLEVFTLAKLRENEPFEGDEDHRSRNQAFDRKKCASVGFDDINNKTIIGHALLNAFPGLGLRLNRL